MAYNLHGCSDSALIIQVCVATAAALFHFCVLFGELLLLCRWSDWIPRCQTSHVFGFYDNIRKLFVQRKWSVSVLCNNLNYWVHASLFLYHALQFWQLELIDYVDSAKYIMHLRGKRATNLDIYHNNIITKLLSLYYQWNGVLQSYHRCVS